mgnify:CR=1 FL=1
MKKMIENQINKFVSNRLIVDRKVLSEAFKMKCEKITLDTNEVYIAKYYKKKQNKFNSIVSETKSLYFFSNKNQLLFPSIKYSSKELLIMNYIENNNIKASNYQETLSNLITKVHCFTNEKFGFNFDSQIGGLKQPNKFNSNWVNFFRENRLNMIFEIINKSDPMPKNINVKLEQLLKNLQNLIPNKPKPRLLHGDLWEGNILFNNGKLVGLIDPGIFYGHNEMEIAYLTWFKYVNKEFLNIYKNIIPIEKNFLEYEPIYQLYYSLLNYYLWDKKYISNISNLLIQLKI